MKRKLCVLLAGLCLLASACGNLEKNLEEGQGGLSSSPYGQSDPVPASQDPDEVWTGVSHDGVSYEINSEWDVQEEEHIYVDAEHSALYTVTALSGGSDEDGENALTGVLGSVRFSEDFQDFRFVYDIEDWPELTTDSGGQYRYNIMDVHSKDGSGIYVAAVVNGSATVQTMGFYAPKDEDHVWAQLDRLLRSLDITGDAGAAASSGEMQQVGTEEFGYVTVPGDWGRFTDLDGGDAFQYSDREGRCIITLNVFSDEGLTEEQRAQVTAELAAQGLWYDLEQNGVEEIQGARVTLNGIEAFQVYGLFVSEDYGEASLIVCWVFEDSSGVIHYVSAEAPAELAVETVGHVESSYVLTAEEADN